MKVYEAVYMKVYNYESVSHESVRITLIQTTDFVL